MRRAQAKAAAFGDLDHRIEDRHAGNVHSPEVYPAGKSVEFALAGDNYFTRRFGCEQVAKPIGDGPSAGGRL